MKKTHFLLSLGILAGAHTASGQAFYGDPPDETHPWAIHDHNRPQPPVVTPGKNGAPPSDAVVLFDGKNLSGWTNDKGEPTKWVVKDNAMECVPKSGYIRSKQEFGDCQLHVEWAAPAEVKGSGQGRGNSGVFLMGMAEVQVLDNYQNPTYPDGFAASVYGINPPLANALNPPGQFNSYDIIFRRPIFKDGKQVDPGYLTVFCNGVLVQDHTPLEGPGGHKRRSKPRAFPEKGPLKLQDHGNPVRFRNIWYRPLPPRAIEGGTDGQLTPETTMAKRQQIAAEIREDAAKITDPRKKMLRLMESMIYGGGARIQAEAGKLANAYARSVSALDGQALEQKKGEIMEVKRAFDYLAKHKIMPSDLGPKKSIEQTIEKAGWNKKK